MHKLDKLASKIVLSKSKRCVVCGMSADEVHHIFSRKNRSVRWYIPNLVPVCRNCHTLLHTTWRTYFEKFDWYSDLKRLANTVDKNADDYWEKYLKGELNLSL